jgi:uncharacterized membrane-anchored protein
MRRLIIALSILACVPTIAGAKTYKEMFGVDAPGDAKFKAILESLDFKQDKFPLPGANANLTAPKGFYYLNAADSAKVLTEIWGNPPGSTQGVLATIFPAQLPPENSQSWTAVITYSNEGYVSDADAASTDFDAVLTELKTATRESSAERERQGYEPITLVGWASPPRYELTTHSLHWARDLIFGKDMNAAHTLNYQLRILGREGILEMNFVAGIDQLQAVKDSIPAVTGLVTYDVGKKYEDFRDGDAVAAYGLAGLIATAAGAKVAAKLGFLAIALAFLKKGGFILAFAAAAIFRPIAKLFKRNSDNVPPHDTV